MNTLFSAIHSVATDGLHASIIPLFWINKKKPYTIQTIEFAHIPAQTCVHWCVILVHNIYLLSVSFRVFFSLANNKTARQFEFLRSSTVKFIAFYLNVLKCAPISIWNCIKLVPPGFTKSNYLIGQLNQQDSTGKKQKPILLKKIIAISNTFGFDNIVFFASTIISTNDNWDTGRWRWLCYDEFTQYIIICGPCSHWNWFCFSSFSKNNSWIVLSLWIFWLFYKWSHFISRFICKANTCNGYQINLPYEKRLIYDR